MGWVGGQSRSPHVRRQLFERFGKQPSAAVHPTEVVAKGAAIVAEALHGDLMVHMADILPSTIRIANADGSTTPLIERGTRLPAQKDFQVSPSQDSMAEIRIPLYRGEANLIEENTFLCALVFPPLSDAAKEVNAEARLLISGDGILTVSAHHPVTGERKEIDLILSEK